MLHYVIKPYQKGYEQDQAKIGIEVARHWIWPYAYDLDSLLRVHAQPDFDPDTRHYCFIGDQMVGYMFSLISEPENCGVVSANLDFPRMMPGHEQAAELLMQKALATLKEKGVSHVIGRITTMCPGDVSLAEKMDFSISDWGYKVYYSYEMGWGKLDRLCDSAQEINPELDIDACANLAARWYQRPSAWCHTHLAEWHQAGIVTHVGVRKQGQWVASCLAARNEIRTSTAALYYIYTPDDSSLEAMLVKVVDKCIEDGVHNLIADLINEHRQYEPVYQKLDFKKVADWALCEKNLT
jgi:hypothetical protein